MTLGTLARKIATQVAFVLIFCSFAWTLVALFTGTEQALAFGDPVVVGALVILTALAWFDGAYWRKQFCIIVCP